MPGGGVPLWTWTPWEGIAKVEVGGVKDVKEGLEIQQLLRPAVDPLSSDTAKAGVGGWEECLHTGIQPGALVHLGDGLHRGVTVRSSKPEDAILGWWANRCSAGQG